VESGFFFQPTIHLPRLGAAKMKVSSVLYTVIAIAAAPLALVLTAFLCGLWQTQPRDRLCGKRNSVYN
jgi:hypothetical protein